MNPNVFQIMQVCVFLMGAAGFIWVLKDKRENEPAGNLFLRLGFPFMLMICGMFAGNITGLKAGLSGFEFSFADVKELAANTVKENPELAEALTGRNGEEAVTAAVAMIKAARTPAELKRVLPYEIKQKEVVFKPQVNNSVLRNIHVAPSLLRRVP